LSCKSFTNYDLLQPITSKQTVSKNIHPCSSSYQPHNVKIGSNVSVLNNFDSLGHIFPLSILFMLSLSKGPSFLDLDKPSAVGLLGANH